MGTVTTVSQRRTLRTQSVKFEFFVVVKDMSSPLESYYEGQQKKNPLKDCSVKLILNIVLGFEKQDT